MIEVNKQQLLNCFEQMEETLLRRDLLLEPWKKAKNALAEVQRLRGDTELQVPGGVGDQQIANLDQEEEDLHQEISSIDQSFADLGNKFTFLDMQKCLLKQGRRHLMDQLNTMFQ